MLKRSDYQVTPLDGQRPEHIRSGFTTDLNYALLKVTRYFRHFLILNPFIRLFFNPMPDNRLMQ
ncbi:hypothetical protein HGO23_14410 [Xenorhabdus budapestensis]|uniref:Transposase n=1 Tax=Xenorhabdus budapestensis TaxID=290110 RepID=A0ABX7VF15_XENBU|nr:hypothetical protein [Xenorhabdus budapestensis]QTL39040.1 hypothetical protein HGO23_14410 [Xenorhabdus budapestensis]